VSSLRTAFVAEIEATQHAPHFGKVSRSQSPYQLGSAAKQQIIDKNRSSIFIA
jgi:hypothetical protein